MKVSREKRNDMIECLLEQAFDKDFTDFRLLLGRFGQALPSDREAALLELNYKQLNREEFARLDDNILWLEWQRARLLRGD